MNRDLLFVTGAPGVGKSTTIETLLELNSDYLVLDIDWLIETSSELADKDLYTDSSAWPVYGKLWFDVIHAVCRNSLQPLFFCPNSPSDIQTIGKPPWCRKIHWLLLDCSDETRSQRLAEREGWSTERVQEAIDDAVELRESISNVVDTSTSPPSEVAAKVLRWASETKAADQPSDRWQR